MSPDGSTYVIGNHSLVGPPLKIFIVKFAADGSIAWQQTWDGPDQFLDNQSTDVAVSPDGSVVYVTGTSFINPNVAVLLKFDASNGSLVWQNSWGGNASPQGVAVDTDGSIYVAGSVNLADSQQLFVTKFAPDGSALWHRVSNTASTTGSTSGEDVAVDSAGNVYVAGVAPLPDSELLRFQVLLLKLDTLGNVIWQRAVSEGEQLDARGGLTVAPDGSVYIAGARLDARDFAFDALVLKFASEGTLLWNRTWGGRGHDEGGGVAVREDGTILLTGTTNSFGTSDDMFFVHLEGGGKAMDAAIWGGSGTEFGNAIAVTSSGDAVIGATVQDPPYAFLKAPTRTSRIKTVVGDPNLSLVAADIAVVNAGGVLEPVAGTTNDDPGFDAGVVVIRP